MTPTNGFNRLATDVPYQSQPKVKPIQNHSGAMRRIPSIPFVPASSGATLRIPCVPVLLRTTCMVHYSFGCTTCGTYTGLRCPLLDHTSRTLWLSTDIAPRTAWYLCTLQTIGRYTCWYTHLTVHTHWYSTTYIYLILYHTVPTIMSLNHTAYLVWYTKVYSDHT